MNTGKWEINYKRCLPSNQTSTAFPTRTEKRSERPAGLDPGPERHLLTVTLVVAISLFLFFLFTFLLCPLTLTYLLCATLWVNNKVFLLIEGSPSQHVLFGFLHFEMTVMNNHSPWSGLCQL